MLAIIKWTLWQRRLSTIWWSIGTFALIFINMVFYPSFKDQAKQLQESFNNLPDAAVQLLGGSTDFFSPVGFVNSQIFFLMLPLVLSVLAISLGSSLIGREEEDQTIENLLARPVSRTHLLIAKLVAGHIILTFVTAVGLLTTIVTAEMVDLTVPFSNLVWTTFACLLLALSAGSITFMIASFGRARAAALGIGAFFALGGYIISSLAGTVSWLSGPSHAFPFHYFHSEEILRGHIQWSSLAVLAGIILACEILSWISFRRRDLS